MKAIILILSLLSVFSLARTQTDNTFFTDSFPGLVDHARSGKLEALQGVYLQWRVDEEGEMLSANFSRIGRKWGYFWGFTKRITTVTPYSISNPFPGIKLGGQFFLNRLHSTFVPFFHVESIAEYTEGYREGFYLRSTLGYGNLIHFSKYFYMDLRVGVGYAFGKVRPGFSGFFGLGFGYNFVNYGRDRKK
jgi:hypothetical protein